MTEYNPRESVKSAVRFLALIAALTLPAFAGDKPTSLQNKLDNIFSAFAPDRPGLAVLVRKNGHTIYQRGFGRRDPQVRARQLLVLQQLRIRGARPHRRQSLGSVVSRFFAGADLSAAQDESHAGLRARNQRCSQSHLRPFAR